ncbi:MAG: ASCH domain-containing protein [Candidatus Paceibacterota bacterium]|jgi:hypothetical protein
MSEAIMKKKILHLILKKKWFDLIASGEKKIEYREYKPYLIRRLMFLDEGVEKIKQFDEVMFRLGYAKGAPYLRVECLYLTIEPVVHPDTNKKQECFLIYLGKILEIIK